MPITQFSLNWEVLNRPFLLKFQCVRGGGPLLTTAGISQPHDLININGLSAEGITSEVAGLYGLGYSLREISRMTGICKTRVRDTLIRAGISLRSSAQGTSNSSPGNPRRVSGNSPYGFKYERGRMVPHPQEFETLLLVMKWFEASLSVEQISSRLNAEKLRPRTALAWSRCTVRDIVRWHYAHPDVIPNCRKNHHQV